MGQTMTENNMQQWDNFTVAAQVRAGGWEGAGS